MALTWAVAVALSVAQISKVSNAIAGVTQLIADFALGARANQDASLALRRRIDDLLNTVDQWSPPRSLQEGVDKFRMALQDTRDVLDGLLSRPLVVRVLHKSSDAQRLQTAGRDVGIAYSLLRDQADLEAHGVLHPVDHRCHKCNAALKADRVKNTAPLSPAARIPPRAPFIYGRANDIDKIRRTILEPSPRLAILGGPGIGKTTLATAALHEPDVTAHFGTNRFYVDCSDSPEGTLDCFGIIFSVFNIVAEDRKLAERQLKSMLQSGATLLILDNFETMWEKEAARPECETVLHFLADIEQLALIVTLRGSERPQGIAWTRPFLPPIQPLDAEMSRQIFTYSAAEGSENDSSLHRILGYMEGVPLALVLTGHLAQYESLDTLLARWEGLKTKMITRSPGNSRLTSLDCSISLSVFSPRMKREPSALELLRLFALLPLGATPSDYNAWRQNLRNAPAASAALLRTALVSWTSDGRIRALTPIREYMLVHHPPSGGTAEALYTHYFGRLEKLHSNRRPAPPDVAATITPEIANFDSITRFALTNANVAEPAVTAAFHLCCLDHYSGTRTATLLPVALGVARRAGLDKLAAELLYLWGWRARNSAIAGDPAALFEEARVLFERVGDTRGVIDATTLGTWFISPTEAVSVCERMLNLAEEINNAESVILCTQRLAFTYERASDIASAQACYERTVILLREQENRDDRMFGYTLRCLSELYLDGGRMEEGIASLHEALLALERSQYRHGAGEVRLLLGSAFFRQGKASQAIQYLRAAQKDFRAISAVTYEAETLRYLFSAFLDLQDVDSAKDTLNTAEQLAASHDKDGKELVWCMVLYARGELAIYRQDYDEAYVALDTARKLTHHESSMRNFMLQLEAEILEVVGRGLQAQGRYEEASTCFIVAVVTFRKLVTQMRSLPALMRLAEVLEDGTRQSLERALLLPTKRFGYSVSLDH